MRTPSLAGLGRHMILPALLLAAPAPQIGYHVDRVLCGDASFSEPGEWSELNRIDVDTLSMVQFLVPRAFGDTSGPAVNVAVEMIRSFGHADVQRFGDVMIRQVVASQPNAVQLVDDHYSTQDRSRTVVWSTRLMDTPFRISETIAVRDTIQVVVRTTVPERYAADSTWQAHYATALDTIVHSICVGDRPVFPSASIPCANVDHVLPFTEKENADGAMFVWFMAHLNGEPYPNAPARSLPAITCFVEVPADSARDGDLAVWPSFVAIYTASVRMVTVVEGAVPILVYDQRFGAPRFLRRRLAQKVDDAIRSACP